MPARPSPSDVRRPVAPTATPTSVPAAASKAAALTPLIAAPTSGGGKRGARALRLASPGGLAVLLSCAAAFLITGLVRVPSPPRCDASAVSARLAERLEDIPALAGRGVTLLGVEDVRRRGHAGTRALRACQGQLVTSAGAGAIEYSIRTSGDGGFSVRPELFQGGWRARLLGDPNREKPESVTPRRSRSARSDAPGPRHGSASPAG